MRHSDELEEIFRKYWNRMSENTRNLAKETLQQAQKSEEIDQGSRVFNRDVLLQEDTVIEWKSPE